MTVTEALQQSPENQVAAMSDEQLQEWYHGHSRETVAEFYRFCKKNPHLTTLFNPWANAWADFWQYKEAGLLDTATGTILNADGSPKEIGPVVIAMVIP